VGGKEWALRRCSRGAGVRGRLPASFGIMSVRVMSVRVSRDHEREGHEREGHERDHERVGS